MSRIERSIEIDAPMAVCYKILNDMEHYPRFVEGLDFVKHKGAPNVWHWCLKNPGGTVLHFDMELDAMKHRNDIISWHTVRDADIAHSGAITLKSPSEHVTHLTLVIEYRPNATKEQEWEEALSPEVLKQVDKSLERFKSWAQDVSQSVTKGAGRQVKSASGTIAPDDIPFSI